MNENQPKPDVNVKAEQLITQKENKHLVTINTPATNALHGKRTFKEKNNITNESVFEYANGQGFLFIKDYEKQTDYEKRIKKLDSSTLKLLNYAISRFTKQNPLRQDINKIRKEVRFKVRDYQKLRGLKNYKETRKQLINDVNLLYDISLKGKMKARDGKRYKLATFKTRILSSEIEIQNGDVVIVFTPEFAEILIKGGHLMRLPKAYFSAKPIASAICLKLYSHARINQNKKKNKRKSRQIISVTALLEAVGSIPSYQKVINSKDRHVEKRIIEPLEKGLDELSDCKAVLEWEYCNAKGNRLTKEQEEELCKWGNFNKLYIKYELPHQLKEEHVIETTLVSTTNDL
jgi:hypothetical protein